MTNTPSDMTAPFVVVTRHVDGEEGRMVPRSSVTFGRHLRESGLLASLSPEELKTLMFLLTFLTPNGHFIATVPQVAEAMGTSERKARERMERLSSAQWNGGTVAVEIRRENGMDSFLPSLGVVTAVTAGQDVPDRQDAVTAAPRQQVVAESRHRYARSREEVEAEIAAKSGWELPDGAALPNGEEGQRYLAARLSKIGVTDSEVRILLAAYDPERIFRQTQWLRHRSAKVPAKYVIAAIENDYDEPFHLREYQSDAGPDMPAKEGA